MVKLLRERFCAMHPLAESHSLTPIWPELWTIAIPSSKHNELWDSCSTKYWRPSERSLGFSLPPTFNLCRDRKPQGLGREQMKAIAVIPARLASTRLPQKALREIAGIPLIGHVYRTVRSSPLVWDVIIATDSDEIVRVCRQNGWNARMTSASHRSGTERVHEISNSIEADVYINVQGDEPMTRSEHIAALLGLMENPAVEVGTLKTKAAAADVNNPDAVKVVTDSSGRALYFSRATIPQNRDGSTPVCFKHLGLYAYRKPALDRFVQLAESPLEGNERLEQLRFLENGISIYVSETPYDTVGVDTEEDLRRVEQMLRNQEG